MFQFLLVVHIIVGIALVGVILMQRSEGGGLAGGGSPAGLMSARGAADFLTRTTSILAGAFVLLSIALAALATVNRAPAELDDSLVRQPGAVPTMPAPAPGAVPLAGQPASTQEPVTSQPLPSQSAVPLAAPAEKAAVERTTAKPQTREAAKPVERRAATPAAAAPSEPAPAPVVVPASTANPPPGDGPQ
jgi:preprotein translocase subunit SecG